MVVLVSHDPDRCVLDVPHDGLIPQVVIVGGGFQRGNHGIRGAGVDRNATGVLGSFGCRRRVHGLIRLEFV
ncbi:hypothetical protein AAHB34_06660 [Paenarthrobacter ureafaciens]